MGAFSLRWRGMPARSGRGPAHRDRFGLPDTKAARPMAHHQSHRWRSMPPPLRRILTQDMPCHVHPIPRLTDHSLRVFDGQYARSVRPLSPVPSPLVSLLDHILLLLLPAPPLLLRARDIDPVTPARCLHARGDQRMPVWILRSKRQNTNFGNPLNRQRSTPHADPPA